MWGPFKKAKLRDYPKFKTDLQFRDFETMDISEARLHFDWFVSQSPVRLRCLFAALETLGSRVQDYDFSMNSLLALWRSVAPSFTATGIAKNERPKFDKDVPPTLRRAIAGNDLSLESKSLAVDIGFYIAEVFIRESPSTKWELWLSPEGPRFQPVLVGFRLPLVPYHLVLGSARKHLKAPKDDLLIKPCQVWLKDLEEGEGRAICSACEPSRSPTLSSFFGDFEALELSSGATWNYRLWLDESAEAFLGSTIFGSLAARFAGIPGVYRVVHADREVFLFKADFELEPLRELLWKEFIRAVEDRKRG
jgi:hypothetical protein